MRLLSVLPAFFAFLLPMSLPAQEPHQDTGRWVRSDKMDEPTGTKVVQFALPAAEAELGRSPEIQLVCSGDGKLIRARYFADTDLAATVGDYANYDAPAVTPKIRIDKKSHFEALWDLWADGKSALLDKKTLRSLDKGSVMRVSYVDRSYNRFTDTYELGGLDTSAVRRACGDQGWFKK